MLNFLKGIVIGLGAVAPGLSGSILLVIFGLYQKTVNAISTIFKNFKQNVKFLFPLGCGILLGILLFSRLVNLLLHTFEMQTRFAFLGLILGSVPLFYSEVKKEGFKNRYYICMLTAFLIGCLIFNIKSDLFPQITTPNFFQSVLLGFTVVTSYVVPGIDSAALLSAFGMYELWVKALAEFDFAVLIPAAVGVVLGGFIISYIINKLISKHYTLTFSLIFGLFISVIPRVINEKCVIDSSPKTYVSFLLLALGFVLSLLFSNLEKFKEKIKK